MKSYLIAILFMFGIFIYSCDEVFEYSPYVIDFEDHETNLTQKNIIALSLNNASDTLTIALTGDTHRFYDEAERMVNKLNTDFDIDFLIHTGDFTDYGIPKQYHWSNSIFSELNAPYFVVAGNHDLVSNGEEGYKEMFGNLNFSFIHHAIKFIFINTNSREYEFNGQIPDLDWLRNEINPGDDFGKAVLVFHTPPFDADFDSDLEDEFMNILHNSDNVLFATHGHLHSFNYSEPYSDGIPFVNTASVEKNEFVRVKIYNNEFTVDVIDF
jgi:3',5'-cyclic AMP phosphodiesterase CpdA